MPENRESDASFYLFNDKFQALLGCNTSFVITALYADATEDEEGLYDAKDGHVTLLTPDCNMQRGSSGAQTPLWPPRFACTPENPSPLPVTMMSLQGAFPANRAIILDFGGYYLKIAYLTHTSVQFYPRKAWNDSILAVSKNDRGFRIGLAIEFKDYYLAFPTNDLVFQPIWSSSLEELMDGYVDLYHDYDKYLELVAAWIIQRATSTTRSGLVCVVMREAKHIWFGVGVYTICELLFMAGMSPFLTELEVFDNPSRTSRICEAFWAYKHKSVMDLPSLLRPSLREGILAPTLDQRMSYQKWLHIYAKDVSAITSRMADLVDTYVHDLRALSARSSVWFRSLTMGADTPMLYDVFEPNYLRSSFELKDTHLGELIFGISQWKSYGLKPGKPNALTKMFGYEGLLDKPMYLRLPNYSSLFVPYSPTQWRRRQTYTYRIPKKQVWCITPCFSRNSAASPWKKTISKKTITPITGNKHQMMLFGSIVSDTHGVAIGPLEYCGNGRVIKMPHKKMMVSIVRHDPSIPQFYAVREMFGLERKSNGLDRGGANKKPMSQAQKRKRGQILAKTRSLSGSSGSSSPAPADVLETRLRPLPVPVKKRRLSADKALVILAVGNENVDVDCISLGRRK